VTGVSEATNEPEIELENDEPLRCTERGQVAQANPRTVFDFTAERSRQLAEIRGRIEDPGELRKAVGHVLKLPPRDGVPDYRILRYLRGRRYPLPHAITYAVDTEPGILALVYRLFRERWYSRPPRGPQRAILYVAHMSSDAELRHEPLLREVLEKEGDAPLFTCDVRGIGESQPETCGVNTFLQPYGCDYFYAIHSLMLDRPYLGQKTFDVLRVLDWMVDLEHTEIHLVAKGWGALAATLAAVLHDRVAQVTLKNALTSYSSVAESEQYAWPLSTLLPDVLEHFDLPDCYRALQAKGLRQIEPWGAMADQG
jgi:pimeloyl-ACP methyl ester carboxylesterase